MIQHLPWAFGMVCVVYLAWLRTRVEIDRGRRELMDLVDRIIVGYRQASDEHLRLLGVLYRAHAMLAGHPELADKLFRDAFPDRKPA